MSRPVKPYERMVRAASAFTKAHQQRRAAELAAKRKPALQDSAEKAKAREIDATRELIEAAAGVDAVIRGRS